MREARSSDMSGPYNHASVAREVRTGLASNNIPPSDKCCLC